ncbi:MAG: diacylglycerol kinase [Anaerolineales bacterium]
MQPVAWIVWNPVAGHFASSLPIQRVAARLRTGGWSVRLVETRSAAHITDLARQAARQKADVFFMAGGDGSLHCALPGLLHSRTVLGVLPSGTANVWAQEIGLSGLTWTNRSALDDAIARLVTGRIQQVDVGVCNQQPFLLWCGIGLDGVVVHRIEPRKTWEKHFPVLQYASAAALQLPTWRGVALRGRVDDTPIDGQYILAVASNIRLYAGGVACISPHARLDDGLLEWWLFEGQSPLDAARHALDLWAGWHERSPHVRRVACRSMFLQADVPLYMQLDGEPAPLSHRVEIRVLPQALRVLMPADVPADRFVHPGESLAAGALSRA